MKKLKISLGIKNVLMILVLAIVLTCIALGISYSVFAQETDTYYKSIAKNIAKTGASMVNGDIIGEYLEGRAVDEAYTAMLSDLYELKENNDVLYMYVERINAHSSLAIMDADSTDASYEIGEKQLIHPNFAQVAQSVINGSEIEPVITESKYGWLVTAYAPVYDSNGVISAHVGVDISMNDIMGKRQQFAFFLLFSLIIGGAIGIVAMVYISKRTIVNPINKIAKAANSYITNKNIENNSDEISEELYEIKTGDEIENLAQSILLMKKDINSYIQDLTEITAEKERVSAELNVATRIQAGLLPQIFPPFPENESFDIYAMMRPAKEVGGDFYDFFMVDHDHVAIAIADVSGKGVPAALFMMMAKTIVKNYVQSGLSIEDAFKTANNNLCENNEGELFVTAWLAVITLSTGVMEWVNAGHNRPLLCHANGKYEFLNQHTGFVLAGMENTRYKSQSITLVPKDRIFIYTDGVSEATNEKNDFYGDDRLVETLNKTGDAPLHDILNAAKQGLDDFVLEAPQFDDITMLAFRFDGYAND